MLCCAPAGAPLVAGCWLQLRTLNRNSEIRTTICSRMEISWLILTLTEVGCFWKKPAKITEVTLPPKHGVIPKPGVLQPGEGPPSYIKDEEGDPFDFRSGQALRFA